MTATRLTVALFVVCALPAADTGKKSRAVESIESRRAELTRLSDEIWRYAETALRETRSSKALADAAERAGFRVERGVAGMPTAFVATYGQGKPVIAILAEFDALPGISQKATTTREALEAGAAGHGCGHNLFGTASMAAAVAVKDLIAAGQLQGTLRLYGTPAEESVYGKNFVIRAGLFRDVDFALAWHPDSKTKADMQSTQALVDYAVEFRGKTAHAALDPWNGRSAVDGMEAFTHGVNLLREHVRPSVRLHYTLQRGGDVPNVVPDFARVWGWARDSTRTGVEVVLARLREIADGAGKIAGVDAKFTIQTGCWERMVLAEGAKLLDANLRWIGPIAYTPEEQSFARAIQRATGVAESGLNGTILPLEETRPDPPGGSSDVGDVSWVAPTLHFSVTTAPADAPWHAWPVVACGGMSIGHKGMMLAAKTLAASAVDLFEDAAARQRIAAEFVKKKGAVAYRGYIGDNPVPLPKE